MSHRTMDLCRVRRRVPAVDVGGWLQESFAAADFVAVKMDIEGGEMAVLDGMVGSGALALVDFLVYECHSVDFTGRTRLRTGRLHALSCRGRRLPSGIGHVKAQSTFVTCAGATTRRPSAARSSGGCAPPRPPRTSCP